MRMNLRFLALVLTAFFLASLSSAQEQPKLNTWNGYLVDKNCGSVMGKKNKDKAMEMAKKHTVACALDEACMAAGYGIVHDGQFLSFDDAGNSKAVTYLKGLTKKKDVFVTVTGTFDGTVLRVKTIADVTSSQNAPAKKG
jgi:hypothetical protein